MEYADAVVEKAQQFARGFQAGRAAEADLGAGLCLAGMGGSGIGNDLVRDVATRYLDVPVLVVKDHVLPRCVEPSWRVLAVSYSGSTEETLAVAREAKRRGVPMTCFTTGGALAKLGPTVLQQPGYQPRMALAQAWGSLLGFLHAAGIEVPHKAIEAALEEVVQDNPLGKGEAAACGRRLDGPVQVLATSAFAGVGYALKAWLNENAKRMAYVAALPEMNHNDLVAWGGDPRRDGWRAVVFSHAAEDDEIQTRLAHMQERYEAWGVPWLHHEAAAVTDLKSHFVAQARGLAFADLVGYETAVARGVDPLQIDEILRLKERLRA